MFRARLAVLIASSSLAVLVAIPAHAAGGHATLRPFDEVPALSTNGTGKFNLHLSAGGTAFTYHLEYSGLQGQVTQAHLHYGQKGVNGGIMIFLCSNLGNGPAGTQACPTGSGSIDGTISADAVIGPAAQGVGAGELAEVLRGMRAGVVYVNVHSDLFPGGEIRGQLQFKSAGPTPTP
jgi:CHRD domain